MKVEDIDAVSLQLAQAFVQTRCDVLGIVITRLVREALGGQRQAPLLPVRCCGEGFLFAIDIIASGINLVVACSLEGVENLVVLVQ